MKKNKLEIIALAIKKYLKKESTKDWIEEDSEEYTSIVEKYSKKLSKHWQKTRDSYLDKTVEKFLDIDEDVIQYDEVQEDESDYIDGALLILAEAFGLAVIIGYEEVIRRGITVDIPENPHKLFYEAGEIKNYVHTALSYEQQQMDEIYNLYNKTDNGKQKIKEWFDNNKYRLTDLIIGDLVWYAINYGFAKAILEGDANEDVYWLTEKDTKVCEDCKALEAGNPYNKKNPLHTLPGGGKTVCGSRCRCKLDTKPRK